MAEDVIEVFEYLTQDGQNPFRQWLDGLKDRQTRARIRIRISRLRLGNFGDSKSVGHGINELRIPHGSGYRIYFGRSGNSVVILLCGGDKRTQSKDIALAQEYWTDFRKRKS